MVEIKRITSLGKQIFQKNMNILTNKYVSYKGKKKHLQNIYLKFYSHLLNILYVHGSESWTLLKKDKMDYAKIKFEGVG